MTCIAAGVLRFDAHKFSQVSEGFGAWAVHWVVLKALMYALGTSNAIPFLELLAYAGYAFVPICLSLLARLTLGKLLPLTHRCCDAIRRWECLGKAHNTI